MKDWIKLGYAPEPVDIRKNIQNFSLNHPLEYNEIMDKYHIISSNNDLLLFTLFCNRKAILKFHCNLHEEYCFGISFCNKHGNIITLYSNDGYYFTVKNEFNHFKSYFINNNWSFLNILSIKEIQNILGIIHFSDKEISFSN